MIISYMFTFVYESHAIFSVMAPIVMKNSKKSESTKFKRTRQENWKSLRSMLTLENLKETLLYFMFFHKIF